ncbi:MAG: cadmium-translocating P-type ATPase [Sphingobacteriales bacterium]|nr:MAG: cadmium-translocating P-type ATPase [Sphingobacteriales bacterium]
MQKAHTATVEGMTCGNCALTISRLLEKKGAVHVSANSASGEVNFTTEENVDVAKIFDAIDGLGYRVVREGEHHDHEGHAHDHADGSTIQLIICAALTIPLLAHMFTNWHVLHMPWVQFALATPVYAIGMYVFAPSAFRSLKHRLPNMDVLIVLGASAAYIYSLIGLLHYTEQAHDYLFFETAASIITLVMFGNWLEHRTVKSTTVAIDALVKLQPRMARVVMTDSLGKDTIIEIESEHVRAGDVVLVNHGDSIPVDGEVVSGNGQVDEHMITGESLPVGKKSGDEVVGGTLLLEGNMKVKATKVGNASVLSSIIRMVREAQGSKPPLQKLADKISAIFVPAVLVIAVLTLLVSYFILNLGFGEAMMRSIAVMVISCPCAMGLATPAAIAVGLGRAARNGMLIKGGDTLERMKKVQQIVFDKTGTLTTGKLEISEYVANGVSDDTFKSVIASLEQYSSHPIAKSIAKQWDGATQYSFTETEEVKGKGMRAKDNNGNEWQLGSEKWLHANGADSKGYDLYLYKNGSYAGALRISDTLRPDAEACIRELKEMGYKTILLSGDKKANCERIAQQLGMDEVYCEQTPEQKNNKLDEWLKTTPTAMVGDGINDAPALARATVGISLSESTQIAIQSAQVILSNNQLSALPKAIRLGIYTEQTIKQNLFWAFIYNIIAIPVAAAGYLKPTFGAGLMALSDVVLVVNSLRLGVRRLRK